MKFNFKRSRGRGVSRRVIHTVMVIFRETCARLGTRVLVLVSGVLWVGGCDDTATPIVDAGALADAGDVGGSLPDAGTDAGMDAGDAALPEGDFTADYCQPLAQLVCARAEQCGCGAVVPSGTLDVAGCEAQWLDQCTASYAQLVELEQSGEAVILGERARACVARIAELTPGCELPQATLITYALCEPFFASATPLGESCATLPCARWGTAPASRECACRASRRAASARASSPARRASAASAATARRSAARAMRAPASSAARRRSTASAASAARSASRAPTAST
jgi:hypothetical protein